jgi:hypothetical protein
MRISERRRLSTPPRLGSRLTALAPRRASVSSPVATTTATARPAAMAVPS